MNDPSYVVRAGEEIAEYPLSYDRAEVAAYGLTRKIGPKGPSNRIAPLTPKHYLAPT